MKEEEVVGLLVAAKPLIECYKNRAISDFDLLSQEERQAIKSLNQVLSEVDLLAIPSEKTSWCSNDFILLLGYMAITEGYR
ncbi:MAG TPA: hypothetical protein VH186_12265 [Chloroflexia bacterium]|nr:hypothetical protein [Chloroflexia bacterium]